MSVTVTATPGTCAAPAAQAALSGNTLQVGVVVGTAVAEQSTAAATPALTVTTDQLRTDLQPNGFAETEQTTAAYYAIIDAIGAPGTPRSGQTLNAWLDENCFSHTATNYGADSHAVYTNNFDLGFGRDMYFVTCTTANLPKNNPMGLQPGDSASVVLNYLTLEAAALKNGAFIAVSDDAQPLHPERSRGRALHQIHGLRPGRPRRQLLPGQQRELRPSRPEVHSGFVHSLPWRHRQQGTMTGVAATGATPAVSAGDIDAGFMPWDVGALLFSDTDPAFGGIAIPKTNLPRPRCRHRRYTL